MCKQHNYHIKSEYDKYFDMLIFSFDIFLFVSFHLSDFKL